MKEVLQMIVKKPASSRVLVFNLWVGTLAFAMLLLGRPAHAADFTVTNTNDSGAGSLRQAILDANSNATADTIKFDIPGSGTKVIKPNSQLPNINDQVIIDGYTQPGASENLLGKGTNAVLKIELSGENGQLAAGLNIVGPAASGSVVRGLAVNRFARGIQISNASVKIEGNFIGTDASGTQDLGNRQEGILVGSGEDNIIGGTSPAARNLISGNGSDTFTDTPGIRIATGEGGNFVQGNLIGTGKDGITPMGNSGDGVFIDGTPGDNTVGGSAGANIIAFNGKDGVSVNDSSGFIPLRDRILNNSIFSNGDLGIDLNDDGVTANDPGDADIGPNNLQNFPVLTSAVNFLGITNIAGTLDSAPNTTFTMQFYRNPSGTDEGQTLIGEKSVTTDASGSASFVFSPSEQVPAGERITVTATSASGDTSEFSRPLTVGNRAPVANDDSYGVKEDATLSVPNGPTDVLSNDSDPDGDSITATLVTSPASGTLTLNENGSFTYTPDADFNGTDSFTYRATDGASESNIAMVSITVNPVNDAPSFARGPNQAVSEDSGSQTVAGWATNISEGPADESDQSVSFLVTNDNNALFSAQPAVSSDGTLTFTPAPNQSGTATASVRIKDDGGTANGGSDTSAPQSFTIAVTSVNDAPVATDDSYTVKEDKTLRVSPPGVLGNDADAEGSALASARVSGPSKGKLTLGADGSFTYKPKRNFHGTVSFTYTASDGNSESNVARVTIKVLSRPG